MKGFVRKFKSLEMLSEEQVESIHQGTLQVLEETGIRFEHEKAMDIFEANGCKVDRERKRVCFPATLVEKCLSLCPRSFSVKAREPKHDLVIGGDTLYFISGCGTNTVDLDTWESRPATKKETIEGIKILDALDNLHLFLAFSPYFGWEGLPPVMGEPEMTAAKAKYSTKVQKTGSINDSEVFAIKMAKALGCEVLGLVNPSPPLTYYSEAAEAIFRYTDADLPFHVSSGATIGLSGPASIIGSTVTNNAELIAGVVLAQLLKPGTRVWVGNFVNAANMRNGSLAFGSIANSLTQIVFNQIWRRYGIPVWSATPAYSSAKKIDFQCGYEKGIAAILAAVSGSHAIHMHGGVHGELTYHPVQSILDDDIAGMVGHFLSGLERDTEDTASPRGILGGFFCKHLRNRHRVLSNVGNIIPVLGKLQRFVFEGLTSLTFPVVVQYLDEFSQCDHLILKHQAINGVDGIGKIRYPVSLQYRLRVLDVFSAPFAHVRCHVNAVINGSRCKGCGVELCIRCRRYCCQRDDEAHVQ